MTTGFCPGSLRCAWDPVPYAAVIVGEACPRRSAHALRVEVLGSVVDVVRIRDPGDAAAL